MKLSFLSYLPMPMQLKIQLVHLLRKSPYGEKSPGYLTLVEGLGKEPLLAYVPNPLPPKSADSQAWEPSTIVNQKLDLAKTALKELEDISCSFILPPSMITAPLIIEDIKLLKNPDEQMGRARYLADYLVQLNTAIAQAMKEPFSISALSEWHQGIFTGPNLSFKGLFRTESLVFVRKNDKRLSYYFTPPHQPMMKSLNHLEQFMNDQSSLNPLIKLGLFFYQLMAIHPFGDGNGRMTRFYATVFLVTQHYLSRPFFFMGPYLNHHRDEYIRLLDGVRIEGAWDSWLEFFLEGITITAKKIHNRMTEINSLYQRCFQLLQNNVQIPQERIPEILKTLFNNPMVSQSETNDPLSIWHIVVPLFSQAHILHLHESADQSGINVPDVHLNQPMWVFSQLIDSLNAPLFSDDYIE